MGRSLAGRHSKRLCSRLYEIVRLFLQLCQNSSATAPSTASFPVDISTIDVNCIGKHLPNFVNASWLRRINQADLNQPKALKYFERIIFFVFTYSPEYGAQAELHVRLYSILKTWGRICPRRMGCYNTRAWSTGNHFPGNSVYRWKGSGWALTRLDS